MPALAVAEADAASILEGTPAPRRHRSRAPLLWELVALFILVVVAADLRVLYVRHEIVVWHDEGSYLELASNLRAGRGFVSDHKWTHWDDQISHPEHNRQPLLPLMVSLLERAVPGEHDRGTGQTLVVLLGLALVGATWAYGRMLFGPLAGLGAALLVAVSPSLASYSAIVMTEVPFALLVVALGLLLHPVRRPSPVRLAAAGAVVGLGYLMRSNGVWLLAPLALALLTGPRPRRAWHWALIPGAFLIVVAPWLVHTERTFGSPVYSASTQVYFVDDMNEVWSFRDAPPGFGEYRRTHSWTTMAGRYVTGLGKSAGEWLRPPLLPIWLLAPFSLLVPVRRRRRQVFAWTAILTAFGGIAWLAPAWGVERYAYPFLPLAAVLGAGGCAELLERSRAAPRVAAAAFVAATLLLALQHRTGLAYFDPTYENKIRGMAGAAAATPPGTIIAERYGVLWLGSRIWQYKRPTVWVSTTIPIDKALARYRQLGARYFLMPDTLDGSPQDRPVVDGLPLVRRGPGWEMRQL